MFIKETAITRVMAIDDKYENYLKKLIDEIKQKKLSKEQITKLKTKLCKEFKLKDIPTDIEVMMNADPSDLKILKKYLLTKPTRTMSGVNVVAIMTSPAKCPHGKCIMCPGGLESEFGSVPQSYTGKEPATRRAIRNSYDPYRQVFNRLEQYVALGTIPQKIELIIMGGTFPARRKMYKEMFVGYALKAMNDFSSMFFRKGKFDIVKFKDFFELPGDIYSKKREKNIRSKIVKIKGKCNLSYEQKRNEKSNVRCVSMVIETRPDYAKEKHCLEMLKLGCTKVELGVQTTDNDMLKFINRGHNVEDSIIATRVLKDFGFKVNYHIMPGLPGHDKDGKSDKKMFSSLFSDSRFRPDMLKIYPCMVIKGTKLYKMWKAGKFTPMSTKEAVRLLAEVKKNIPRYVRIMRVQRDIPTFMTEAGVDMTNLRQKVLEEMKSKGLRCNCIRCREIGRNYHKIKNVKYITTGYYASEGKEYFIEAVSDDSIIGFLRLRMPSQSIHVVKEDDAMIRELHVYGETLGISEKGVYQHRGIGKRLLKIAEDIARKNNKKRILVISGIGVREYYRRSGYRKVAEYMGKSLNK